jgi:hypothetical protein
MMRVRLREFETDGAVLEINGQLQGTEPTFFVFFFLFLAFLPALPFLSAPSSLPSDSDVHNMKGP